MCVCACVRVRQRVKRALTQKRHSGRRALERGHSAALERLEQLGDALSGVGAAAELADAAERVVGQAAKERRRVNGR